MPPVVTIQDVHMNAPPSPPIRVVPVVPNTVFGSRMRDTRLRSVFAAAASGGLASLSIAQMRARTAEWKVDTAISSAGQIADQTICA